MLTLEAPTFAVPGGWVTPEDATRLLLRFWRDVQPGPRTQNMGDVPGVAPSHRIECPNCQGTGRAGRFKQPCLRCGGRLGELAVGIAAKPGRGWIVVDDYTRSEVGTEETGTVNEPRRVTCDSCGGMGAHGNGRRCGYCHGTGWREVAQGSHYTRKTVTPTADAHDAALEACSATGIAHLWRTGSFAALERALSELQPWARFRIWATYVDRSRGEDDGARELLHILAIRTRRIDGGKVRVPATLLRWREATERPHHVSSPETWRKLHEAGESARSIARRFGIAPSTVTRSLARSAARE